MRRVRKIAGVALAVIIIVAAVSCGKNDGRVVDTGAVSGDVEGALAPPSPFASFREIPGVTAEEIADIESLRQRYSHFVYGVDHSIESFPLHPWQNNESGINAGGEPAVGGFAALLCQWLSGLFGIPFIPAFNDWNSLISKLESGDIHFMGDLTPTEERRKTHFMTSAIVERSLKSFKIAGAPSIAEIAKSRRPRLAFMQVFAPFNYVREVVDYDFDPVFVSDPAEAYRVIKSGEADAFLNMNIAEPAFDIYGDVVIETFYPLVFGSAALSTRKADLEPVISVVQKALENGGTQYLTGLYRQGRYDYIKNKFFGSLEPEEIEYIKRNHVVKVATESDSYPLSFYNRNDDELQGIAFDIMRELKLITGLSFEIASPRNSSFLVLTEMVESGEASMITAMMRSRERERRFLLPETSVMQEFPILVSKSEFPNVQFNELSDVTVGIVRGTLHAELFKRWFPNNRLFKEYDNMDSAFAALVHGEVDMFMCMSNYLLSITNYKELIGYKANVVFDNNFDITFGFKKSETVLYSIVDKALQLIDLETISRYWTHKTYDYRAKIAEGRQPWLIGVAALSLITLALILTMFYRGRNLRKQKEAEVKMREADERAQIIFDTAPLASCMYDKNGDLIDCNQEVMKMFGVTDKEYYFKRAVEFSPEYQLDGILSAVKADRNGSLAIEKGFHRFEWTHQRKNGEIFPVEITLVRVNYKGEYAVAGYIRDLTEQKAKEQLTKEVMEKTSTISAIFDATPDLIFCKDSESRITECNKSMEDYFDIRKSDIIGKNDIEAFGIPSDLVAEYTAGDRKIFQEKKTLIVEEFIPTSGGKNQLFETIKSPLIQNGEVTGLVVMSRDITQRKEMARQQAEAEAASRAKSSFLATMSHEMRTPMNAIIGMTTIGKNSKDVERKDYALHKIEEAAAHLLGVINDVLDISKIEANKLELSPIEFSIERMLQRIVSIINFRMDERHQKFTLTVDKNLPRFVVGDDHRLSQVIMNLLSNAVKFSPEKGEIDLSVTLVNEQDGVCEIRTEVSDNGIGISPEQQAKLFGAFQQADSGITREFGGTGLGLSISKHIVELMGGRIWVESETGKGSRFIFTVKAERGKKSITSMLAPGIKRENMRVLVVDDEKEVCDYFKDLFAQLGINCGTAADGFEAFNAIEDQGSYDIYFIDWRMPGMDGMELTRKIKAHDKDRPSVVVMISSADWAVIKDMALDAGVSKYILKPLFSSAIIDCINECLGLDGGEGAETDTYGRFAGKKLLVAEDVEINREILLSLLEDSGLSIECAENGVEAVEMIAAAPDKYDAVLMDVQMPKMDGLEATRLIRKLTAHRLRNLPIIAMTAHVFKSDIEECLKAGMNDHIGKPIDIDDVMKKLNKYLSSAAVTTP